MGYPYGRTFGSKMAWANRKEGDGVGVDPVEEQVVKGNDTYGGRGRVCEGDMACVRVNQGMAGKTSVL